MPRHRPLKTVAALVCLLCATNAAHAVPLVTDWSYSLSSIRAQLAERTQLAPPQTKAKAQKTFTPALSDAPVPPVQYPPASNNLGDVAIRLVKTVVQQASAPATGELASPSDAALVVAAQTTLVPDTPPLRFSNQLSLWVAVDKGPDARQPHFVGSQDSDTRLAAARVPIQDGFPLDASALNGLPALARGNVMGGLAASSAIRSLPEPTPLALLGIGLLGVTRIRRSPR